MSTGWQCRRCGYEPDYNELNVGSCPDCSEGDRELSNSLPDRLNALPIGSCVQVWKWSWSVPHWSTGRKSHQYRRTRFLFEIIGRFEDGTPKWRNARGKFNLLMDDGETVEQVQGESLSRLVQQYHDLNAMTTKSVVHFSTGELVYGFTISIHDPYTQPAPTASDLARERLIEGVGMAA